MVDLLYYFVSPLYRFNILSCIRENGLILSTMSKMVLYTMKTTIITLVFLNLENYDLERETENIWLYA